MMAETLTPSKKTVAAKLLIKPKHKVLILNAPPHIRDLLGTPPEGAELHTETDSAHHYDIVVGFAHKKADADGLAPQAIEAVKAGGVLWFCYPKQSAKLKTDINRDHGWETLNGADFLPVAAIAVDDTWSALRFRPRSEIKTLTRKF
jgi:hypothetical protein